MWKAIQERVSGGEIPSAILDRSSTLNTAHPNPSPKP